MVQPGELAECEELCGPMPCECREVRHDRAYQHRNLAALANGREHLLYAHADMFLDLFRLSALFDREGGAVVSPAHGLVGTTYQGTSARCVALSQLNASRAWFWHLNSKEECARMLRFSGRAFANAGVCCYGWVDMVRIHSPRGRGKRVVATARAVAAAVTVDHPATLAHPAEARPVVPPPGLRAHARAARVWAPLDGRVGCRCRGAAHAATQPQTLGPRLQPQTLRPPARSPDP
eukprot:3780240-Prymnesium_polylepis.1